MTDYTADDLAIKGRYATKYTDDKTANATRTLANISSYLSDKIGDLVRLVGPEQMSGEHHTLIIHALQQAKDILDAAEKRIDPTNVMDTPY